MSEFFPCLFSLFVFHTNFCFFNWISVVTWYELSPDISRRYAMDMQLIYMLLKVQKMNMRAVITITCSIAGKTSHLNVKWRVTFKCGKILDQLEDTYKKQFFFCTPIKFTFETLEFIPNWKCQFDVCHCQYRKISCLASKKHLVKFHLIYFSYMVGNCQHSFSGAYWKGAWLNVHVFQFSDFATGEQPMINVAK